MDGYETVANIEEIIKDHPSYINTMNIVICTAYEGEENNN